MIEEGEGVMAALERGGMVRDTPGIWYAPGESLRVGQLVSEGQWRVASHWRDDYYIVERVEV